MGVQRKRGLREQVDSASEGSLPLVGCRRCARRRYFPHAVIVLLVIIIMVCAIDIFFASRVTRATSALNKLCKAVTGKDC